MQLYRADIVDTPVDPLREGGALRSFADGALVVDNGTIVALGDYPALARRHPSAERHDYAGAILLPGLIDLHVHFPQLAIIGSMGLPLLAWLSERCRVSASASAAAAAARPLAGGVCVR